MMKQSHPAYCEHRSDVGLLDCSNECQLIITVSPLTLGYDFLIVDRCPIHLNASYGVVVTAGFEPPIDDSRQDNWGAF